MEPHLSPLEDDDEKEEEDNTEEEEEEEEEEDNKEETFDDESVVELETANLKKEEAREGNLREVPRLLP